MFETANETIYKIEIEGLDNTGLQVLSFDGLESLNAEFAFEVTLVNKHRRFDITRLLSKPVYLSFTAEGKQGIHGIIHHVKRGAISNHYAQYKIIIAPRFSHLYKRRNQRAFVDKTVPVIIETLLNEYGMLQGDKNGFAYKFKDPSLYTPREFCVQYNESDGHFIHRLCEEEGWAMHYAFTDQSHQLIFSDAQPFFTRLDKAIAYQSDTGFVADHPALKRFDVGLNSATRTASFRNYNFKNMKIPEGHADGQFNEKGHHATEPRLESYGYPSPHLTIDQGNKQAQKEIERLRASHVLAEGHSDIPTLHAGYLFSVEGFPPIDTLDSTQPWLMKQIWHQARQPQVLEALGGERSAQNNNDVSRLQHYFRHPMAEELEFPHQDLKQGYRNCFVATPQAVQYRPARLHQKPQILGSQTAIVVGPEGEEIYCDEHGRVKVQFHWDRDGNSDENSSHWLRVVSNWAHDGYGTVILPRVGMEVKIDFLEGDPDHPMVSGAIHNGVNKVPYDLPANKTRSVFKTSSSKGGVGSNELRIEDKAGQEQLFVQAQRDFDQLTKHNHTLQVNNNSHLQVGNEYSELIKKNRYAHIQGEEHHLIEQDRKTQLMQNEHTTILQAEHTQIGTVQTVEAGEEIHLKAGMNIVFDGGVSLTLTAGGQHLVLNPGGIWMSSPVHTGGAPMRGTPTIPMLPLTKVKSVASTAAPIVVLPENLRQQITTLAKADLIASPLCQKTENEADPDACALGDNCPCKQKRASQGVH